MKRSFFLTIPMVLLFAILTFQANAQCSYNIGEPNETCSQTSSTWPVSTSTNNIVGCVEPFDYDYYRISVSGLTYYVRIMGDVFNITQGNYWLKMWKVGNVLHLKTQPWGSGGANTKIKLKTPSCAGIAGYGITGVNTSYLTYDFTQDLRIANPNGNGELSMEDVEISRVPREAVLTTYAPHLIGDVEMEKFVATDGQSADQVSFRAHPQPASNVLNIEFSKMHASANIALFDLQGKMLRSLELSNAVNTELNTADLSPGVYMLRVETPAGVVSEKVAIQ